MVGPSDHYSILGIPRSATAAEIRRSYREQALLHHPDKNPDRVEEATERFKLIAEAFSVLSDPQQRSEYDSGGQVATAGSANARGEGFSASRAHDLFGEVFGSEFAGSLARTAGVVASKLEKVAQGAAPHVKAAAEATASGLTRAAERAGRTQVVRGAVAAHLSSLTDEASFNVASKVRAEALAKNHMDECLRALHDHEVRLAEVYNERRERKPVWWQAAREWVTGDQRAADRAFDYKSAAVTKKLHGQVHEAQAAYRHSQRELANAEAMALRAQQEEEHVQQNGASLKHAATAGAFLLGRLSEKLFV